MIKILHYCWFGKNPLPESTQKYIESWKKYCPDFELKCWDETNFDIESVPFTADAYSGKKWAFVSDYVRTYALYHEGGLYLDTDVELIGSLDDLLAYSFLGFEEIDYVNPGLIAHASEKQMDFYGQVLEKYHSIKFDVNHLFEMTSPIIYTEILEKAGLKRDGSFQCIDGINVYPTEYFNPLGKDWRRREFFTKNTRSIHHFHASWFEKTERQYFLLRRTHGEFWGKVLFCLQHPVKGFKKWLASRNR